MHSVLETEYLIDIGPRVKFEEVARPADPDGIQDRPKCGNRPGSSPCQDCSRQPPVVDETVTTAMIRWKKATRPVGTASSGCRYLSPRVVTCVMAYAPLGWLRALDMTACVPSTYKTSLFVESAS